MANFTKEAIRNSFIKLLNEKNLNKITVKEIVDNCGVNRNTFYYYYHDIPSLMESIISENIERIVSENSKIESFEECIDNALMFALNNKKAVLHIYNSVNRDIYEQYQWRVCAYIAESFVERLLGPEVSTEDAMALSEYWKCASFGLIIAWLESGMDLDGLDRMCRILYLKNGHLKQLIDKCKNSV